MTDNQQEPFPIVDEKGNVIGSITRGEAHSGSKILHPVVHLHVFNSQGELYLQKRPEWKYIQPGKWDTATGGHICYGETKNLLSGVKSWKKSALKIILPSLWDNMFLKANVRRSSSMYIAQSFQMQKNSPRADSGHARR